MLQIISAPNPVLAQVAKPIKKIDQSVITLIEQMKETLANTRDPEGIGLAAPQVGTLLQLFIVKPTPKAIEKIFINPVITQITADQNAEKRRNERRSASGSAAISASSKKKKSPARLEGCLSLPQIWGDVVRYPSLTITYLDPEGKTRTEAYSGLTATIIQHEYDHLQGILFPRRVLEQKGKLYKSKKGEKGEEIFEEITI